MTGSPHGDPRLLDDLAAIVEALVGATGVEPPDVLLVGARCRDILHASFGHSFPARATTDTDIAIDDWAVWDAIDRRFARSGGTGIRYTIAGLPVDIVPFGPVEDPEGISRPRTRREDVVVFGFRNVHRRSSPLALPSGRVIRLPSAAGYTALKLRSWVDRARDSGAKDAQDLALASHWYQESRAVRDRLYADEAGFAMLEELDFDTDLAAIRLLGRDAADELGSEDYTDLVARWTGTDLDALARSFTLPASARRPLSLERRRRFVAQLVVPA